MHPTWILVPLLAVSLAGCLDADLSDSDPFTKTEGEPREFEREETEMTTTLEPTRLGWVATKTVTLTAPLAGAAEVDFLVDVGSVTFENGDAGYRYAIRLEGRGETPEEAEEALRSWQVEHEDEQVGDHVAVSTEVTGDDEGNQDREAHVIASVPSHDDLDLDIVVVVGTLDATGLRTGSLELSGSNAVITARDMTTRDLEAGNVNGRMDLAVTPTGDSYWDLVNVNGAIRLQVPTGPEYGYDFDASTVNGRVTINVPEGSGTHEVYVDLATVNGSIDVDPA